MARMISDATVIIEKDCVKLVFDDAETILSAPSNITPIAAIISPMVKFFLLFCIILPLVYLSIYEYLKRLLIYRNRYNLLGDRHFGQQRSGYL